MKKDPSHPTFYKFQLVEEKSSIKRQREWNSKMETRCQAKVGDMVLFENMMKEDLEVDDFKLMPLEDDKGGNQQEDLLEEIFGGKKKGRNQPSGSGQKPGTNWDSLSKVEESADQETMQRQIMKFKAEMVKEEGLFENLFLSIRDAPMEQKTRKELSKTF